MAAEKLEQELDEFYRQQREITEQFRDPGGIRRIGLSGSGPPNLAVNGDLQGDRNDAEDQPLPSAAVKISGPFTFSWDHGILRLEQAPKQVPETKPNITVSSSKRGAAEDPSQKKKEKTTHRSPSPQVLRNWIANVPPACQQLMDQLSETEADDMFFHSMAMANTVMVNKMKSIGEKDRELKALRDDLADKTKALEAANKKNADMADKIQAAQILVVESKRVLGLMKKKYDGKVEEVKALVKEKQNLFKQKQNILQEKQTLQQALETVKTVSSRALAGTQQ